MKDFCVVRMHACLSVWLYCFVFVVCKDPLKGGGMWYILLHD